jgi:hypothetical protein
MEVAYDPKALVEKLKVRGVSILEGEVPGAVDDVFAWVAESAELSKTPLDNVLVPFLPMASKFVKEQIAKIKL